jgi:CRISPR/Cas system-associated exonuclease Cas4 (RecB family)
MSVGLEKIPIASMMLVIISKFEIKTFTVCAREVWYIKNYI